MAIEKANERESWLGRHNTFVSVLGGYGDIIEHKSESDSCDFCLSCRLSSGALCSSSYLTGAEGMQQHRPTQWTASQPSTAHKRLNGGMVNVTAWVMNRSGGPARSTVRQLEKSVVPRAR